MSIPIHATAESVSWSSEDVARTDAERLLRVLRASAGISLFFQATYLMADWRCCESQHQAVVSLHILGILTSLVFLGTTYLSASSRFLASSVLGGCSLIYAATAMLSLITLNRDPLTFTITITTICAAALMPWSWRWQAALGFAGAVAMAASTLIRPEAGPHVTYDWLAILAALGAGHYVVLSGQRYRREIASRIMALGVNHNLLIAESAEREAGAAVNQRIHQQLLASEAKLRKVFETSTDLISINRFSDGRYLDVNDAYVSLGYTRDEMLGGSAASLGIWSDCAQMRDCFKSLTSTGSVTNMEIDVHAKDGHGEPFLISAKIVDLDGEKCIVTIGRDIRAIKRTEGQLRAEILERTRVIEQREVALLRLADSERKFRKIFETSPDAISIHRLSDGRYLDVNQGFGATGYSREEALQHTAGSLGIWADRSKLRSFLQNLKSNGTVVNLEIDVRLRSGSVRPYLVSATIIDLDGESCVVAICRDITTMKETEKLLRTEILERTRVMGEREIALRELADSESKLRKIFEVSPDSISIVRMADGKITEVNQNLCTLAGLRPDEIIGRNAGDLRIWNDAALVKFFQILRNDGRARNMDAALRNRDGRLVPHIISSVITELDGELCAISIAHDISDLKRVERELLIAREEAQAASRAKSEFLSSMSHEIRTPMNAILGMAQLLEETELTADQKKYLEIMTNSGDALLDLINGILDLARIESGRLALEVTGFNLETLVDETAETLGVRAHQKGLEMLVHVRPDVPLLLSGDRLRLRQILLNLVGNAIKFTEAGQVLITVERDPESAEAGNLHFTVADTGIGIAADKLEEVFANFTQADSSTTRHYGGSGLGLTIVRRLVALMGGRVWVDSELGRGSAFHFTARFQIQAGAPSTEQHPPRINLNGIRVLVVDDNVTNRLILREMLSSAGAEIDEVGSGQSALEFIEHAHTNENPYRLILLDCRMPGMNGFQVAQTVKARTQGTLTVLMLTSEDLNIDLKRAHELAIDAYLVKPVRRSDLFEAIQATMARRTSHSKVGSAESERTDNLTSVPGTVSDTRPDKPLSILLADDSEDNRLLVHAFLKGPTYRLDDAENGAIALVKLKAGKYDLVLMDMHMPVMDGLEATREIRAWEKRQGLARTRILALTASALEEDVRRMLEVGIDTHISKPIKKAALEAAIKDSTGSLPHSHS